jgi:hypothetical protein
MTQCSSAIPYTFLLWSVFGGKFCLNTVPHSRVNVSRIFEHDVGDQNTSRVTAMPRPQQCAQGGLDTSGTPPAICLASGLGRRVEKLSEQDDTHRSHMLNRIAFVPSYLAPRHITANI